MIDTKKLATVIRAMAAAAREPANAETIYTDPAHDRPTDSEAHAAAVAQRLAENEVPLQQKIARMNQQAPAFLQGHNLRKLFERIIANPQNPQRKIAALWDLADRASAAIAPEAACKKGCNHCCHIAVAVTKAEAQVIGQRIGRKPREVAPRSKEIGGFADVPYGYGNPCTFLKNGLCSIYDHRPMACRIHFNMDRDALLCMLDPPNTSPVPYYNSADWQLAVIYAGCGQQPTRESIGLGDIREFFPHENKDKDREPVRNDDA
jgi:Fe-S-cluster containining protein